MFMIAIRYSDNLDVQCSRHQYAGMARTPAPPKRRKPSAPLHDDGRQPYSFMLPPELIMEFDIIAARESRSRVRMLEVVLRDFVLTYRHRRENVE